MATQKDTKDIKEIKDSKDNEAKSPKQQALKSALSQIEKDFGVGAVMKLGDRAKVKIDVIPTGSIALDIALGVGGVPRGRIVEIYGPESSGKTTLVQHIIAEAQKAGGTAALIDAENAFDPLYAEKTGVNVGELLVSQPDTGEQALDIAETLIRSNALDVIAIDSVAALVPQAELEGEIGDSTIALQARLMSKALRRITGAVNKSRTTVIFTNQLRTKIGVMFGNPETTSGGRALRFYASVRLEIRRIESIKEGNDFQGNRVRVKVVKNKVAPPFKTAEFDIMFNEGISKEGNLLDVGTDLDLVEKSGSWYSYKNEKLGQGRINSIAVLRENTKMRDQLEAEIREIISNKLGISPKPLESSGVVGETPSLESSDA
ncbi:MAG TPA: recombinase RecA [candidate division WWE3 bacterium]|uniref:Protein RecA n=1 Tax=candidate division WWE3 bacterium TaxID=2053526 RepID=A0A7C1HJ42_UNCKA|nr:recombinase RecA [candidate division WWE3 bacterium]